jgi:hypothetical protein
MERRERERLEHIKRREEILCKVMEMKRNYKYYYPSKMLSIDEEQALGQAPQFNPDNYKTVIQDESSKS